MNTAERSPANRGSTINAYRIQTVTWYSCNHGMTPHTRTLTHTHTGASVYYHTGEGKFIFCISRVNKCLSVTTTFSTNVRIRIIEIYILFKKGIKKFENEANTQISIVEVRVGRAQDWSAVWFGWSSMLLINKNLTQSTPWMTSLHRPPIFCHCCS